MTRSAGPRTALSVGETVRVAVLATEMTTGSFTSWTLYLCFQGRFPLGGAGAVRAGAHGGGRCRA